MADRYPSPCINCNVPEAACPGKSCNRWQIRYRYRQKQINAYAKRIVEGVVSGKDNKWQYPHPDETRRFLAVDPCDDCICRNCCNGKCLVKGRWKKAKGASAGL